MVRNQDIVAAAGSHPKTLWTQNRTGRLLAWSHKDRRGGSPSRVTNSRVDGAPASEPGASSAPPSVKALASSPFTMRQPGAARDRCAPLSFLSPFPKARAIVASPALTLRDGGVVGGASSSQLSVVAPPAMVPPTGNARTETPRPKDRSGVAGPSRAASAYASASGPVASRPRGESDAASARRRGRTFCEGRA